MATYKPIQSTTLTTASSSITLSGIDQNYTDLILVYNGTVSANQQVAMRFNGSSAAYYSYMRYSAAGTTPITDKSANQTNIFLSSGNVANPSVATCHINNYSSTTMYKTVLTRWNNPAQYTAMIVGTWRGSTGSSTEAITSITINTLTADTFTAGSTFSLYGIKSGAPQALGGDIVTTDGNYWYHAFRSTQSFVPQKALTVDYLVVAGGGAGYYSLGGGGGAGGLRSTLTQTGGNAVGVNLESALSLNAQAYTVTIGAGGAATTGNTTNNGSNSSIIGGSVSITSTGGGSGGGASASPLGTGFNGGSGGGGGGSTTGATGYYGGTGTTNQGYGGGRNGGAWGLGEVSGGGGGGAGAVGVSCTQGNSVNLGGAGGAGVAISAFATATGTGVSNYYAGGGGGWGSGYPSGNGGGAGGVGGGGAAGTYPGTNATAGTANTGGGGGGGHAGYATSGSGGSGIVIVRYPV